MHADQSGSLIEGQSHYFHTEYFGHPEINGGPIRNNITLPKTNMDTQNDGLEKVTSLPMALFGIYVRFLGCRYISLDPYIPSALLFVNK